MPDNDSSSKRMNNIALESAKRGIKRLEQKSSTDTLTPSNQKQMKEYKSIIRSIETRREGPKPDTPPPSISETPPPNMSDTPKPDISETPKPKTPIDIRNLTKERIQRRQELEATGRIAGGQKPSIPPKESGIRTISNIKKREQANQEKDTKAFLNAFKSGNPKPGSATIPIPGTNGTNFITASINGPTQPPAPAPAPGPVPEPAPVPGPNAKEKRIFTPNEKGRFTLEQINAMRKMHRDKKEAARKESEKAQANLKKAKEDNVSTSVKSILVERAKKAKEKLEKAKEEEKKAAIEAGKRQKALKDEKQAEENARQKEANAKKAKNIANKKTLKNKQNKNIRNMFANRAKTHRAKQGLSNPSSSSPIPSNPMPYYAPQSPKSTSSRSGPRIMTLSNLEKRDSTQPSNPVYPISEKPVPYVRPILPPNPSGQSIRSMPTSGQKVQPQGMYSIGNPSSAQYSGSQLVPSSPTYIESRGPTQTMMIPPSAINNPTTVDTSQMEVNDPSRISNVPFTGNSSLTNSMIVISKGNKYAVNVKLLEKAPQKGGKHTRKQRKQRPRSRKTRKGRRS